MVKKYIQFITAVLLTSVLVGCGSTVETVIVREPVEVLVPVQVKPEFPQRLLTPYKPVTLPTFISPNDPKAVVGLSETDLLQLRVLIRDLVTRDSAWRAFANEYSQ